MRCYFFGNMYLSPIQQGIQALHVIGDMSMKYSYDSCDEINDYINWATNHKTVVLLNGGMSNNLDEIIEHFEYRSNPFAWDYFEESKNALNGATTCVGIILPERVYDNAKLIRTGEMDVDMQGFIEWEIKLYAIMNSCRLA